MKKIIKSILINLVIIICLSVVGVGIYKIIDNKSKWELLTK
jgi:hypothetical protein